MLRTIESIREAERTAGKIVDDAKKQVEEIRRETEEKLRTVYRKTYGESIAKAKHTAEELIKDSKENANLEAEKILQTAQTQTEKLQKQAKKNFYKAVNFILNELLS